MIVPVSGSVEFPVTAPVDETPDGFQETAVLAMDGFRQFSRWLGSATPGLKTGGLYRYSRNPQFVAYGALILGAVIAWGNPLGVLGLASYLALAYAVARIEEEHLARIYGQDYLDYCARVPRFFGRPKLAARA